MTTMREKLIEAASAPIGDIEGADEEERAWQLGQAVDAILETLASPDEGMVEAGDAVDHRYVEHGSVKTPEVFTAMINHLREGK